MYWDNGDCVVPWHCCIDPGDCVGFDPICCGEDEGWALLNLIYETLIEDV